MRNAGKYLTSRGNLLVRKVETWTAKRAFNQIRCLNITSQKVQNSNNTDIKLNFVLEMQIKLN